ncbi:MAG: hypothetical protein Q8764_00340 [Pigeon pea little leaf phytoplasma]|uniref:Effector n=1 Tax=Candidatus Phytoplasma fabacearum TaxID=2982628 RepID=A0ABU8ZSF6_9MOLU|nr:hypothetical protein ['Bituminaria bituminosa' little leaf phytoplasma]MDV3158651.1 hypothetical protein [Pigeon pea little leaf phytoplasma]MDO8023712.1 hypothetical protein ['Bituminaria bituminosa' little leaf phytoplasma]MDV3161332.1 hypothetical protein [Pigeon pea little leaf phytoplasma]MDV3195794.1 hypothetical protein [Pigeon pea little leaf phytoplasma]MDV3200290.1 hypothetical protein [Pigeon pea little leaf phytoplasma]
MNIRKIFNYKVIVCIMNLLLISGMFFAIYANYQTQKNSNEMSLLTKSKVLNKYNDDLKRVIPEKQFVSVDQELFKSVAIKRREKIFQNDKLIGFKIYEHESDEFPVAFEEYNDKNFIIRVTTYNNSNGLKLYTIQYVYDRSKVIHKIKEIYNDLQQIIQIEIYNVNYISVDKSNDLLSKVTKYNNFNNVSYTIDYIYDKTQKVIRTNKDIYNDKGKRLFTEVYDIIDNSDISFLRKKIRYSLKSGIIEAIFHYSDIKDNKKTIVKQFFVGGLLDKTVKEEIDLLANKKTKIVYQDRNDEIFKISKYDLNRQIWCSDVYKNKVIVDRRCEYTKDKSNRSYKHYQKLQNKDDLVLVDEQFIDEQNNVWNKQYIYKANGELDHFVLKQIYY